MRVLADAVSSLPLLERSRGFSPPIDWRQRCPQEALPSIAVRAQVAYLGPAAMSLIGSLVGPA